MLLEKPNPGRADTGSVFLGEAGLAGSISNSLCWVASSVAIILETRQLAKFVISL